jgi:hypothetical protein
VRDKIDAAVRRRDEARGNLYRPDGSKRYGEEEHREREAAVGEQFRAEMDALEEEADRSISAAEEDLLVLEHADPADALTTAELERANAKRAFVADDCRTLPLDALEKRCRAALAGGDRATMFLLAHHAAQRVSGGADGREEEGAEGVREIVGELLRKLNPDGERKTERARERLQEAQGIKDYAYLRRRGASNAGDLYAGQAYGHLAGGIGR